MNNPRATIKHFESNISKGIYPVFHSNKYGRIIYEFKNIKHVEDKERVIQEANRFLDELKSNLYEYKGTWSDNYD